MPVILAATDLSDRADRALERAHERANAMNLKLVAVHVLDSLLPDSLRAQAAEHARAQVRTVLTATPGAEGADICIVDGQVHRDLLTYARDMDAQMIVVGIHRNANGPGAMVGSTIERLVRCGPRPVLMVRDPVVGPYAKVLVAADFSPGSRFALRTVLRVAPDAEVHVVNAFHAAFEGFHVGEEVRESARTHHETELTAMIEDEVERALRDGQASPRIVPHVRHGEALQVIRAAADELKPQLLAMGTHARTGLSRMVLGSVAEHVLARPPCDVLVVRGW